MVRRPAGVALVLALTAGFWDLDFLNEPVESPVESMQASPIHASEVSSRQASEASEGSDANGVEYRALDSDADGIHWIGLLPGILPSPIVSKWMKDNVRINTPVFIVACQSWEDHTPAAAILGWTSKPAARSYASGIAIDVNPATWVIFPMGFAEQFGSGTEPGRVHVCTSNPCATHRTSPNRKSVHAVAVGFFFGDPATANLLLSKVLRWPILDRLGQAPPGSDHVPLPWSQPVGSVQDSDSASSANQGVSRRRIKGKKSAPSS